MKWRGLQSWEDMGSCLLTASACMCCQLSSLCFDIKSEICPIDFCCYNVQGKRMMILQLSKANHFLETLFGYDSIRKLEQAVLHKQDQFHMEVHFPVIYPVAQVDQVF